MRNTSHAVVTSTQVFPIRQPVPGSLEAFFQAHRYHARYIEEFGDEAFAVFGRNHIASWLDTRFPRAGVHDTQFNQPLDIETIRMLARYWHGLMSYTPRDVIRALVDGERSHRWVLPVLEGLLSEAFWKGL